MLSLSQPALGQALRLLRNRLHLKQYLVADRAAVTKAMLSSYETGAGTPSLQSLAAVLNALDADLYELQDALSAVASEVPRPRLDLHRNPDLLTILERASELKTLMEQLVSANGAAPGRDEDGESTPPHLEVRDVG